MLKGQMLLAERAYDANWIKNLLSKRGAWANIPPKSNRKEKAVFNPYLYKTRNKTECFFNKLKYLRRIATRYDRCADIFFAAITIAAAVIFWLN